MPSLSVTMRRRRDGTKSKFKVMRNHDEFLSRIKKTLYYGKLPLTERFSLPVTELATELFSEVKYGKSLERLHLEEAATMSRNACVSPCSLVLALLYLERLKTCNPDYLQRVAPSELFLVSMMVASKFLHEDGDEDEVYNDEWAALAGLSTKDINRFEKDFLQAIEWEVFVSERAFWTRLSKMERDIALKEGKRRGWFSYTDLQTLLDIVDLTALAQTVITVSAVCLTSYTASILTLIGSAFIVSQIPGTPINIGVSPRPCNLPATNLQDSPINDTVDLACRTSSPVNVLTTSFILASLGSCSTENDSSSCYSTNVKDLNSTYVQKMYHSNRNSSFLYGLDNYYWQDVVDWTKYWFFNWHLWNSELGQHNYSKHLTLKAESTRLVKGQRKHKLENSINKSGLHIHSQQVKETKHVLDSQDWITEIRNWLDKTPFERSPQTKFFPIEIAASNY